MVLLEGNGLHLIKTWTCLYAKGNWQGQAENAGNNEIQILKTYCWISF